MTLTILHFNMKSKCHCAYQAPRHDDLWVSGGRIMMITYD